MERYPPRYWAELPAWLPGHYKVRTSLSNTHVLQVSGHWDGSRHRAVLYRIDYAGRLKRIWSMRLNPPQPGFPAAKRAALSAVREWAYDPVRRLETYPTYGALNIDALRKAVDEAIEDEKE